MDMTKVMRYVVGLALMTVIGVAGCDAMPAGGGGGTIPEDIEDIIDGDDGGGGGGGGEDQDGGGGGGGGGDEAGGEGDPIQIQVFATNTGTNASGIALHPATGELYLVNTEGLFGPIEEDADVSELDPIGAENIFDDDLFDNETSNFVLAISASGEFWIGSACCSTLAVVQPEGGNAEPFLGLLRGGVEASNIKPTTMAFVPDGFSGPQMQPGNLLVGVEVGLSDLSAIDVEGFGEVDEELLVANVDKPIDEATGEVIVRFANHLAFGLDNTLYGSAQVSSALNAGIQTIDTNGFPTDLPGTVGVSGQSFVVLQNNDLLIRGVYNPAPGTQPQVNGIVLWSAETQEVTVFEDLPDQDLAGSDELIISEDLSTVYLALPERSEIWRGTDTR
jgi:hypothetical protein